MAKEGGETKLRVTWYSDRSLTKLCTVLPFFKSPTEKAPESVQSNAPLRVRLTKSDGDTVNGTQLLSDGEDIEQTLRGVLSNSIAGVEDRHW